MTFLVSAWALVFVLMVLAATVPPMPYKGALAALAAASFVVSLAWASSGAVDCYPDCSVWQDTLAWLFVGLPVGGVALYSAIVVGGLLRRHRRSRPQS